MPTPGPTTAFDAKKNLVTRLREHPGLRELAEDDAIWYGFSGRSSEMPRKVIWVGEIEWDNERPEVIGGHSRDEYYKIMLGIEVHTSEPTQEMANEELRELVSLVESILREPTAINLPNVISVIFKPVALGEGQDSDGRGAVLIASVHIHARK